MILFSKSVLSLFTSLYHILSNLLFWAEKRETEREHVPANSSLFICFFGLSENQEKMIQRCVIIILRNSMRLLITSSNSFHSFTLLLLLQWLALMDFFIALLYCNMISSSDLEHIVRINCHTARREGLKNERGRMRMVHFCSINLMVFRIWYLRGNVICFKIPTTLSLLWRIQLHQTNIEPVCKWFDDKIHSYFKHVFWLMLYSVKHFLM